MRKNYFFMLLACLMFFVAPSSAQVASMADLLGDYKYTSETKLTDAGQAYADAIKAECDVTISSHSVYAAMIAGFAGAEYEQPVASIDAAAKTLNIVNPNGANYGLWSGYVAVANANGDYPFSIWDAETQTSSESYSTVYTYDADTKVITIPDFTIVKVDFSTSTCVTLATVKNAKLTMTSGVEVNVPDMSGEWTFKAGAGAYDTMEGSTLPKDFAVAIAKSGDANTAYDATFSIEGLDKFTLPATFDGLTMTFTYDSIYPLVNDTDSLRLVPIYGATSKKGSIVFNYSSEKLMTLSYGFSIGKDTIYSGVSEATGNDTIFHKVVLKQYYNGGSLRKADEAVSDFTWDGLYNVKVAEGGVILAGSDVDAEWPYEFGIEVVYYEAIDAYYVSKFLGYDVGTLNQGGFKLTPSEDGKSASIALDGYYGTALLYSFGDGTFLQLTDQTGTPNPITLTLNDDGTLTLSSFFVQKLDFGTGKQEPVVFYQNMTAVKPTAEAFVWAGDFIAKASAVNGDFSAEFLFSVTYFDVIDSYYVTKFMGNDIGGLNQGGLLLTVAEDGKSAELKLNGGYGAALLKSLGNGLYTQLADANGGTDALKLTVENGVITFPDFKIMTFDFGTMSTTGELGSYSGVTATVYVPEPFSWDNTYLLSANVTSLDGKDYPSEFEVVVIYNETYEMYLVTNFMGNDVAALNYGGILLTVAEDNNSAELRAGSIVGTIVAGESYYKIANKDGSTTVPVKFTLNEDGTISGEDFYITNGTDNVALYKNVVLKVKSGEDTGIGSLPVETVVKGIYDLSGRRIEQITAPGIYIVNGKKVLVK